MPYSPLVLFREICQKSGVACEYEAGARTSPRRFPSSWRRLTRAYGWSPMASRRPSR